MSRRDRYIYYGGDVIKDLCTGEEMKIQDAVDKLNACERVFDRIVEVTEQREEAK